MRVPPPVVRSVPRLPAGVTAVADPAGQRTRADVFAAVLTAGPLSRVQIAERLGVSQSTVTKIVNPLVASGHLREEGVTSGGIGRPRRLLRVEEDRHLLVGVKVAPGAVTAVLTDMGARVLARTGRTLPGHTPRTAIEAAADAARELIGTTKGAADKALAIGVGVSGHVDPVTGVCRYSALLDWRDVDVAGPLSAATGLPVVVSNDVNTLVVAEQWFGHGRDTDTFAVVTVGAGVGCGLLLGGRLHVGSTGLAGEFGHQPLDPAGPVCSCGSVGCLEALASHGAVLERLRAAGVRGCGDIAAAASLARSGQGRDARAALAAFADAGRALGRGLAGLCNLLNPEKIIMSGEGAALQDLFTPAMTTALREHAFSSAAGDCRIVVDEVDDDLWARGAACLVIREAVGV